MMRAHTPGAWRPVGIRRRVVLWATVATLAASVVGCDEHGRLSNRMALSLSDPEMTHPIGFSSWREDLYLQLPPPREGLSQNQYADVYRFVKRYKAESNGQLTISRPGRGVRYEVASSRTLDDVREALREAEIDERRVDKRHHAANARSGRTLRLSYVKPVAIAPECGLWMRDVGVDRERVPYPQFGCATQRNLANMVANARDLQRPQDEDPSSSERRSSLWSKYVPPSGVATAADDAANKAKAPSTTGAQK